ncbi:MAG: hypothetical protein DRJ07_03330, partial [Bacteroidetes bacterium]
QMTGFSNSKANVVLVHRKLGSGLSAEAYENYFELAVHAIRAGIHDLENVKDLQKFMKEQHLDKFIKVLSSLNIDSLCWEDDIRNSEGEEDY